MPNEIKNWLLENRDIFTVSLSFDGTKEMQDTNRSNSYDKIDTHFFAKELNNGVGLKMSRYLLMGMLRNIVVQEPV